MSRVLITGITGYIGSHLARALLPEWEVYGLVREPLNLEYLEDIQEKIHFLFYSGTYESMSAAIQASQPDLVYHLATYYTGDHSPERLVQLLNANIVLGGHLLEAMYVWKSPAIVYASTYAAHYQGEEYRPINLYAATKQAFSDLLAYYTDAGLLRAVTLVISDTYGPKDHRPKVLNAAVRAARAGEKMSFSAGTQVYDIVYIDDVVSAFALAGEQLCLGQYRNEVFQIVSEAPLSLRETVEKMLHINHLTLNAGWGERPAAERAMTEALRLYPTVPGWIPRVSLEEGLSKLAEGGK